SAARARPQQVINPRGVVGSGTPLGHDGVQGRQLAVIGHAGAALVIVGGAADQDAVHAGGEEQVGAGPPDQKVAAQAANQHVVASPSQEDVVGRAAGCRKDVVAIPAVQQRRQSDKVRLALDKARQQEDGIVAGLTVNNDVPGRQVVAEGGAVKGDIDVAERVG